MQQPLLLRLHARACRPGSIGRAASGAARCPVPPLPEIAQMSGGPSSSLQGVRPFLTPARTIGRGSQVVRHGSAKPSSAVRFRLAPPILHFFVKSFLYLSRE